MIFLLSVYINSALRSHHDPTPASAAVIPAAADAMTAEAAAAAGAAASNVEVTAVESAPSYAADDGKAGFYFSALCVLASAISLVLVDVHKRSIRRRKKGRLCHTKSTMSTATNSTFASSCPTHRFVKLIVENKCLILILFSFFPHQEWQLCSRRGWRERSQPN